MKKMQCNSIDYHSKEPFFEIQCSIKGILSTQTGNLTTYCGNYLSIRLRE